MTELFYFSDQVLGWSFVLAAVTFVLSLILVPVIIIRLPSDYFREKRRVARLGHPLARTLILIVRNALGLLLLVAGIAMLVLPGQGVLTILVALGVMDFPGKYRLERSIVRRPAVANSLNWVRRKAGKPPLVLEAAG